MRKRVDREALPPQITDRFEPLALDAIAGVNGRVWYESTNHLIRAVINGVITTIGAGGGGGGLTAIRVNGGAIGSRSQINFIEGSGITIGAADDGTEIDLTINGPSLTGYVPYTGATSDLNLGSHTVTAPTLIGGTGTGSSLTLQSTSGVGATDFIKFAVGNAGATEAMRILTTGQVVVGETAAISAVTGMEVVKTIANTSGSTAIYAQQTLTMTSSASRTATALALLVDVSVANTFSDTSGTGVRAISATGQASGAGTTVTLGGGAFIAQNTGTGIVTTARVLYAAPVTNSGGGSVTTATGLHIDTQSVGTSSNYGLRIEQPALANGIGNSTNNFAIYVPGATASLGDTSGTTGKAHGIYFGATTYTSTATTPFRTITDSATFYITGAPTIGANVIVTNGPYALWIDSDDVRLDGNVMIGSHTSLVPLGTLSVSATTGGILTINRNDTSVTANDMIGRIDFRAIDLSSATNQNVANIEAQATNTIGTDINPGRLLFRTTPVTVAATPLERLRLDEAGSAIFSYRVQEIQGADVASANNLVLGSDGNTFEVTGTTQVQLISNLSWQNGSVVRLLFTAASTVKHAQATSSTNITILLAGASDFAAAAGASLVLVLSEIGGTQAWREVTRTGGDALGITFTFGDGINAMVASTEADQWLEIPFNCAIDYNRVTADASGSVVFDLWVDTYANYPPAVADTVTASAKPTLSAAIKSEDLSLTGWTKTLAKGSFLRVHVDSATTVKRAVLSLGVHRT